MRSRKERHRYELREAWSEFVHEIEKALKLQLIVNWIAKQLEKYEKSKK